MSEDDYEDYEEAPRRASLLSRLVTLSSWAVSLAAIGLGAAFMLIVETQRPGPPAANNAAQTIVVVPRGAGVGEIADHLAAEGVIRNAMAFRGGVLIYGHGRSLKAGEYAIASRESAGAVIDELAAGKVLLHPITAPEGWTSAMIIDMLANSEVLDGDTPSAPPEGSLLPETYRIERGAERRVVVRAMQDAQKKVLTELWPKRAKNLPFSTPAQAVTLASIVEKETGVADERPRVAAVFVNRLRKGMKLESDPTVIYSVSRGRPLGHGITVSELNLNSPFNTYKNFGLPPSPISNPGRASLEAVLNPASTGDLYFVADGSGGHAFAASLSEHQKNVARWRGLEKLRGVQ